MAEETTEDEERSPFVHPSPLDPRPLAHPVASGFQFPTSDSSAERLADALGIAFKDLGGLRLALTHRSVLKDLHAAALAKGIEPPRDWQSNERLEFLGDALLGAIVADTLYRRYPEATEGALTARRVALIRAETLVRWAREIDLGAYLLLGHGERVTSGARDRMLAGAFEALVGAIFLDRGQREAARFVRRFLLRDLEPVVAAADAGNPKGRLQELFQERYRLSPAYAILETEGPDHDKIFTAEVRLEGRPLGIGVGVTKRLAEEDAAREALAAIETGANPLPVGRIRGRAKPPGTGTSRGARRRRADQGRAQPQIPTGDRGEATAAEHHAGERIVGDPDGSGEDQG